MPASGGTPEPVTTLESGESRHVWPDILPGGKAVLFTVYSTAPEMPPRIAVQSLETGKRQNLVDGIKPRYSPTGHIVFTRDDSLWAVPFDADRLEVTGSPTPVLEGVLVENYEPHFTLGGDGSLVYVPGTVGSEIKRKLVWVDRQGVEQPLTETLRGYQDPRLSPDGRRLAVTVFEAEGRDIWVLQLARGTLTRLTFEGLNGRPIWSPDGERILFGSDRVEGTWNIFSKAADGSGTAEQLTTGAYQRATSVSSDGKTIVFRQGILGTNMDIGRVRLEGEREPEMLLHTPFSEHSGMLSPDDHWLAYVSNESGREEVYVTAFPSLAGKLQVSTEGGNQPVWSRDGQELFYRNGGKMMAVSISTEPELALEKPTLLFEGRYESDDPGSNYDVTADGRFVMIRREESAGPAQINVVLNWFEELKRLVPPEN